jgi:hypothetical protein
MRRRVATYGAGVTTTSLMSPIVFGWLLFAVAMGVGILIGWAIWRQ